MKVYTVVISYDNFNLSPDASIVFSDIDTAIEHANEIARRHQGERICLIEGTPIKEFRVAPQPVGVVDLVP